MFISFALIGNMGPWEWIIILAVVLLIFGPTRLPKLARNLGKSINEFKRGVKEKPDEKDSSDTAAQLEEKKNADQLLKEPDNSTADKSKE